MNRQYIINQKSTVLIYPKYDKLVGYVPAKKYCPHCNDEMINSDVIGEYTDYTCDMLVKCHKCGKLHTYSD